MGFQLTTFALPFHLSDHCIMAAPDYIFTALCSMYFFDIAYLFVLITMGPEMLLNLRIFSSSYLQRFFQEIFFPTRGRIIKIISLFSTIRVKINNTYWLYMTHTVFLIFFELSVLCFKGFRRTNRNKLPPYPSNSALQPVWTRQSLSACSWS